ncbi:unnamed protein product, partial [Didymodactylos carnosus]
MHILFSCVDMIFWEKIGRRPTLENNLSKMKAALIEAIGYVKLFRIFTANIYELFEHIRALKPMNKTAINCTHDGCEEQTAQMENFLEETFGMKNTQHSNEELKYFIQDIQAFELDKPIKHLDKKQIVEFPSKANPFYQMTVEEIQQWQKTFHVYAADDVFLEKHNGKDHLKKALTKGTHKGDEAFNMKFVCRISKNPIFMEYDGKVIIRNTHDLWPHYISLVTATAINLAGRDHDSDDIQKYISNWKYAFDLDKHGQLKTYSYSYIDRDQPWRGFTQIVDRHGRDFRWNQTKCDLEQDKLYEDLVKMVRLRLRTCDLECIQIVIETGLGTGIFSGDGIGIGNEVRTLSAKAIKQQEGQQFQNIEAVIFALPIMPKTIGANDSISIKHHQPSANTLDIFIQEFNGYTGIKPVLLIDQDMHKIAICCAKLNFQVSELNSTDSHGIFGGYWQNRGPGTQEKLVFSTAGLLTQHHIVNHHVHDTKNYHLISVNAAVYQYSPKNKCPVLFDHHENSGS